MVRLAEELERTREGSGDRVEYAEGAVF